ncbi:MAG TPA: DUF305 domain-containing protein [Candidatus Nanoarchaeia archaeon]|nr:DUF305 domain-containing protein [Candidatus Nanoarchaeia archaeon]
MVDTFSNVFPNYNQFYMAGLMATPMVLIELWLMGIMYSNKKLNAILVLLTLALFVAFWIGIRQQVAIGDKQFLKSMIPHHGAAILMCKNAPIEDLEIKELCQNIIANQQSEIDFMKNKLEDFK